MDGAIAPLGTCSFTGSHSLSSLSSVLLLKCSSVACGCGEAACYDRGAAGPSTCALRVRCLLSVGTVGISYQYPEVCVSRQLFLAVGSSPEVAYEVFCLAGAQRATDRLPAESNCKKVVLTRSPAVSLGVLFRIFFTISTCLSASPLDCGNPGFDVMCFNSQTQHERRTGDRCR